MWQRNNGIGEINILQNQFTKYLMTAIELDKAKYLDKQSKRGVREILTEEDDIKRMVGTEHQMLETIALEQALDGLSKRDRYIFVARVLDKKSYDELASELGIGYKGVAAAYYRVLQKLKQALRGG